MIKIGFYPLNAIEDSLFKYAVIVSRYQGKWVYSQHKLRDTWEIPGGRREACEAIWETAKRELYEETGAMEYQLSPVSAYCVMNPLESYGMLCFAEILKLGPLPDSEIGRIGFFETAPEMLTYPAIQPTLFAAALDWLAHSQG